MRWSLGLHVTLLLLIAVGVAGAVLALLWLLLGRPYLASAGPLKPSETYDAIKIALTVVAGVGGVVALVVAYRRQHFSEAADLREHAIAMTTRFGAAAEQLGSEWPAVRMAGAYAMARVADDWSEERQTCIDVLCGYLRMPHDPNPPEETDRLTVWRREREVRVTVLRLIAAHLRDGALVSWQGCDLDFTGAVLDGADFRGVRFTGGDVVFVNVVVAGHDKDQVVFDDVEFAEGSSVYFRSAEFRGGDVRFHRAKFTGGWVTFDGARFTGADVDFHDAKFEAGEVHFEDAEFAAGLVDFTGASFQGCKVNFAEYRVEIRYSMAGPARFTGGTVDLSAVADFSDPPRFGLTNPPLGLLLPDGIQAADLPQ
ncbi:hypothetical protein GCM10009780_11050 [Actinomadura alba]